MEIPFNKIYYTGSEMEFIRDALNRKSITGDGYYTELVSLFLEEKFKIKKVLMTTSATHALEMASLIIGLEEGDEVILPSFTFPSTVNAVTMTGARPVFAEIREDTLNIDPGDIERKISGRTRAIIAVDYGGIGCQMDIINDIAEKNGLYVIEDAAQGVNGRYQDKYLGAWGDLACYSFHGTKNYVSGEGGALLINNRDRRLIERAEIIRQNGTNKDKFKRGEINKYSWVGQGSSYLPSDLLMALLYSQLTALNDIYSKRKYIHDYYADKLSGYLGSRLRKIMYVPEDCQPSYHLFYLVFDSEKTRDRAAEGLKAKGISAVIHYLPLHSSPVGRGLGYSTGDLDLPLTEETGRCLLRLPMYTGMLEEELEYVVTNLVEVLKEI